MKFRMIHLGYRETPDYPWGYRIELTDYLPSERDDLTDWLAEHNIKHITAGWNTGSVIYMRERDAGMFALRWAS